MTAAHPTHTSTSEGPDATESALPGRPLSLGVRRSAQVRRPKSGPASTWGGIPIVVRRGLVTATLLATAAACTYSDGSMDHESTPHEHGPGAVHAAAAHHHTTAGDGLAASLDGYTLDAVDLRATGAGRQLRFRILGPTGAPQLQFALDQGKLLHLYVVSKDLASFHHLHPVLDSTGTWQVELPPLPAGQHRVVASFVAIGEDASEQGLLLGTDLTVPGRPRLRPLPEESQVASADGYRVRISGDLLLAQPSDLRLEITRQGRRADLVPYLESWVHMSAVNADSGALVHLHPAAAAAAGSAAPEAITLTATPPAPGRYRLFVEFATGSGLHRVAFTRSAWG